MKTKSLSESENLPENGYYPAWQNPKQPDSLFFTESPATFCIQDAVRVVRCFYRVTVKALRFWLFSSSLVLCINIGTDLLGRYVFTVSTVLPVFYITTVTYLLQYYSSNCFNSSLHLCTCFLY